MNTEDLSTLGERALTVEGRPDQRLDEVHRRIDRARRNRQRAAVVATVVAIVLVLMAGTALLTQQDPRSLPPTTPTGPTPTPQVEDSPSVRRLTYATGQTIHWGDRVIDVGDRVAGVAASDDGVVFTFDREKLPAGCSMLNGGCGELWFTDGSDIVRIGRALGTSIRGYRIEVASAGSTVVWFEPAPTKRLPDPQIYRERGEYVVYDTRTRREVARVGSGSSRIEGVYGDTVYWTPDVGARPWCADFVKSYAECRHHRRVMLLDTATGAETQVTWKAFVADRRSRPRMFALPIRGEADAPGPVYEEGIGFEREKDRLVASDGGGGVVTARVAASGVPVRLRLPAGYHDDVASFFHEMWLNDDQLAISADNRGDILVCALSSGRCRVALKGPRSPSGEWTYGFGGRG